MLTLESNADQIEAVRDIVEVFSDAEVLLKLNALSNAGWQATIRDIAAWELVKDETDVIKGDGIIIEDEKKRLIIRNRVRVRLGYPKVGENGQILTSFDGDFGTQSIDVFGGW